MNYKHLITGLFLAFVTSFVTSCKDDSINDLTPGNPVLEIKTPITNAHFGDNLPFTVAVSDDIPLSTLIVRLYFGDEKVSEKMIRTTANGEYSGTIAVPYLKDIPNGKAKLEFTLTDTHTTSTKQTVEVAISRPAFPYLILVTEKQSYPMLPTGVANEYAVSESFPSTDLPAYIKAPKIGDNGTEITFGWDAGKITQGVTANIPFSNAKAGKYTVTFNTVSYVASPFFEVFVNGQKMAMLDKENLKLDMTFTKDQEVVIKGIDLGEWWIDPDFFKKGDNNTFTFVPMAGKYRIIANTVLKYLRVQALDGDKPATLQADGSGAIWVIGEHIGKPNFANNQVGWTPENALCMAPMGDKKYQITVVGGQQVNTDQINFKFFHQMGWSPGEYKTEITTTSDLITITASGNLELKAGVKLENGVAYVFTIDVSAGIAKAVLTVQKK